MRSRAAIPLSILAAATVVTIGALMSPDHPSAPDIASHSPATPTSLVVDPEGFTVYRFDQMPRPVAQRATDPRVDPLPDRRLLDCDGGTPPDWPPVIYRPDATLRGIDASFLGYLERADGTRQLTVNGCPVYRYAGDHQPGQTAGHGKAGVWFAITPAGRRTPDSRAVCRSRW
jgi:predicted lipoprotein with Yx(FWY)xxD motif